MKIKTFSERKLDNLEQSVNIWMSEQGLASNNIHSITFSERESTAVTYTVLILYTPS